MSELSDLDDAHEIVPIECKKLSKGRFKGISTAKAKLIDWQQDSRRKAEERFDANRNTAVTLPKLKYLEG